MHTRYYCSEKPCLPAVWFCYRFPAPVMLLFHDLCAFTWISVSFPWWNQVSGFDCVDDESVRETFKDPAIVLPSGLLLCAKFCFRCTHVDCALRLDVCGVATVSLLGVLPRCEPSHSEPVSRYSTVLTVLLPVSANWYSLLFSSVTRSIRCF